MVLRKLIVISLIALVSSCASQERIMNRFKKRKEDIAEKFKNFRVSCFRNQDLTGYNFHQKQYKVLAPLEDVWKAYTTLSPDVMWAGPVNKFKEAYSKKSDIGYHQKEENIPGPNEGMVYELKLKIVRFLKIPVNFEITQVSEKDRMIEFTYGAENKSKGKQQLFFTSEDGITYIDHHSYFYSGNKIRDKKFYPKYHEKCCDEFHFNLAEEIIDMMAN